RGGMLDDALDLERDRARVARVQHGEIDDRRPRCLDRVALPVGDRAVYQLEEDIETERRHGGGREALRETNRVASPLEAPAGFQEEPGAVAAHVLLREAGESRNEPQRLPDPVGEV